MPVDLDLVVFIVASFGLIMGIGSVVNATLELRECWKSGVNGATHLSAIALANKAVLTVLAQIALMVIAFRYARDADNDFAPELAVAVFALAAKVTYDFIFHLKLYALVRPRSEDRRRRSD